MVSLNWSCRTCCGKPESHLSFELILILETASVPRMSPLFWTMKKIDFDAMEEAAKMVMAARKSK